MIKLRTILLYDYLYIVFTIIMLIISLLITNLYTKESKYRGNETNIVGYIHSLNIDGNKLTLEIIAKEKVIGIYYFNNIKERDAFENTYKLGDYINTVGEMNKPKNNTVFNLFNYKRYLYNNNIFYLFNIKYVNKINSSSKMHYNIKQTIIDHINNVNYSSPYLKLFILGDNKDLNNNILTNYRALGISHLFAVSGMHVSLLALLIFKFLKKIKVIEFYRYLIVILFLLFYMFLTDYSASILRASIFFILLSINKYYFLHIKTINILLLTLIINIIINPYIIYNIGFQFSFIISFYLILFNNLITNQNNYIYKLLMVSFISFIVSFPIVIYNFYQINLLSIVYNLIFVPLVSIVIFPLSLLTFIFPILDKLLYICTNLMEYLTLTFNKVNTSLIFLKPNTLTIIIYYIVITYTLYSFKKVYNLIFLIILIVIHYISPNFNSNYCLTMIDVNQGDSILIRLPNNKGNILIDTGGSSKYYAEWSKKSKEYSLAKDTLIPYFKSIGIRKLDCLIITHGHLDHMGEANTLINNFKINNVIFNKNITTYLEQEIMNNLDNKNIPYSLLEAGDKFSINNQTLYFLAPFNKKEEDLNDSSLVIYTSINNKNILLTGDASTTVQDKILDQYNINNLYILKVSHHGSITGTNDKLLSITRPKHALISVGEKNKFNHPHNEVISLLKKYKVETYLTSINGSIQYIFKSKAVTIRTCPA